MADALGETFDPPAGLDRPTVNAEAVVETDDDARLVRAARAGDRVAFGHLYDRYARIVHCVLLARVPLVGRRNVCVFRQRCESSRR